MTTNPVSILLVEDDYLDIMNVERELKKLNVNLPLCVARNGREALNMLRGENGASKISPLPSVVMLDINMPKISGFDVAQQLRSAPQLANTPIIALTANATKDILSRTLEAGCDGYITKPVDVDKLPAQILNYIARRRQAR